MKSAEKSIARRKMFDALFAIIGLLALLADLGKEWADLICWQFCDSYPSRFTSQAGILSAWVGTTLVMLVTAATAVPLGVAAGVYLEEYASRNWLTALIEINIANLAGVPSIV